MRCSYCGQENSDPFASNCSKCGAPLRQNSQYNGQYQNNGFVQDNQGNFNGYNQTPTYDAFNDSGQYSHRSHLITILLCYFLGFFGVHRFYLGKIVTGILWIITCGGGCGIGNFIDFVRLLFNGLPDKEGKKLLPDCGVGVRVFLVILAILPIILAVFFGGTAMFVAIIDGAQ